MATEDRSAPGRVLTRRTIAVPCPCAASDFYPRVDGATRTYRQRGVSYQRTECDTAGAVASESERSHTYTIEAKDDRIEGPAGTFDGCTRVRRSRVRAAGDPVAAGDDDLFRFCPGIDTTGQTEELVAREIPGGSCR